MSGGKMLTSTEIVDVQIAAIEEIKAAQQIPTDPWHSTNEQRQRRAVALNTPRCPRCGQHVVGLFPVAHLCGECTAFLHSIDAPIKWFVDIVNRLNSKKEKP